VLPQDRDDPVLEVSHAFVHGHQDTTSGKRFRLTSALPVRRIGPLLCVHALIILRGSPMGRAGNTIEFSRLIRWVGPGFVANLEQIEAFVPPARPL
jgi:hypothetical protein